MGVKVDESGAYNTATPVAPGDYSSWSVTLTNVPTGSHKFFARATDGAGNMNWYDVTVNVIQSDTTPPAQVTGLLISTISTSQLNLTSINLTNRTLVQHGYPSNQSFLCHRDNGNGEVIWFRIRNTAGTDILAGIASSPSLLNRWAHITCVYDNSLGSANLKIYEDGILGGTTGNLTQAINLSAALTLDGAVAGFQAGKIKDFRWWTTKALTNTEINDVRANLPWMKAQEILLTVSVEQKLEHW